MARASGGCANNMHSLSWWGGGGVGAQKEKILNTLTNHWSFAFPPPKKSFVT